MLQKHSKDIIFILIILILIGIIWGVEKNIWILIAINVVVVMVCLLYVNMNDTENQNNNKKYSQKDYFFALKNIVNDEINNILVDVDYDNFNSIKKGKEILNSIKGEDKISEILSKLKEETSYDIEMYYLGLTAFSLIELDQLTELDYKYYELGKKIIYDTEKLKTKVTRFIKDAKL